MADIAWVIYYLKGEQTMRQLRAREIRNNRFTVYFSDKEMDQIWQHVAEMRVRESLSEFIRRSALEKIING